ncbi:hypothetical protein GDO78_023280 [Eleutherodactylus coqui]|uniref:Uncharacterized protein n=1 Tax=Eleutherodactylus coqui TaxID=57060 RepID=A0A8J6B3X7_ELECQ|nr:hypothetical protein GDO78_023280 [Eleutherodactylus coqui]
MDECFTLISGAHCSGVPVIDTPFRSGRYLRKPSICCFCFFFQTNELYQGKFKDWAKNYPFVTVISDGTSTNEERLGAVSCLQLIIEAFSIDDSLMVIGGDTLFYEDFHLQDVVEEFEVLYRGNSQANLVLSYTCKDDGKAAELGSRA